MNAPRTICGSLCLRTPAKTLPHRTFLWRAAARTRLASELPVSRCEPVSILQWRTDMLKRFTVMAILLALFSLAIAPETFACHRHRRAVAYRSAYYGNSYYRSGYG